MGLFEVIEPISGRHENTVGLRSLFFCGCKSSSGGIWFTLNSQIKLAFGLLVHFDKLRAISSRVWALFWVEPRSLESMSVASERSKLDALLFLLGPVFFIPRRCLQFQRTVDWQVRVNVRPRAWIRSLQSLVDVSLITAVESCVDSLFHNNSIFDVIFLLFMIVMTWSWVLCECLPCVRSSSFMLPEFASLRFGQERLRLLPNILSVWGRS